MRLLILQSMFLVSRVWAQLPSCFRNAIKGVACAQTSILLGSAIKCVHLCKFIVLSAVAALAVSLSRLQMAKILMGARKKELGACHENEREDREHKCSHNAVKFVSRMMSTRESSST